MATVTKPMSMDMSRRWRRGAVVAALVGLVALPAACTPSDIARDAADRSAESHDAAMVPDVVGLPLPDATNLLARARLSMRTEGTGPVVITQRPAPGTSVPLGTRVTLSLDPTRER